MLDVWRDLVKFYVVVTCGNESKKVNVYNFLNKGGPSSSLLYPNIIDSAKYREGMMKRFFEEFLKRSGCGIPVSRPLNIKISLKGLIFVVKQNYQ